MNETELQEITEQCEDGAYGSPERDVIWSLLNEVERLREAMGAIRDRAKQNEERADSPECYGFTLIARAADRILAPTQDQENDNEAETEIKDICELD